MLYAFTHSNMALYAMHSMPGYKTWPWENVRWVKGNWEKKQGNIWYQLNLRQGFFFNFVK
jgi:hypothetical protein